MTVGTSWNAQTDSESLYGLATSLKASVAASIDLQAAWAESHGVWAYPMRDGAGKVVGIRLRARSGD